jgi:hypothetical protein
VLQRQCASLVAGHNSRVGQAKGQAPFYSARPPDNLATTTRTYSFTSTHQSLNGHFLKGNSCLSSGQRTVRDALGSSEAHIRPMKNVRMFVPSKEWDSPH